MTHKEGIGHLTNDWYKDQDSGKICIDAEKADAFLEAVGLGIKAMKALSAAPTEDQPLSLEQMREMDGQPVWYKRAEQWFIIELHHPDFGECVINASGYYIPLKKACKREFYAYPPTRAKGETTQDESRKEPALGNWTEQDMKDAEVIANVFGREATLKRTLDGALCFDDIIINAQFVPSLKPGQSVDLREIRRN